MCWYRRVEPEADTWARSLPRSELARPKASKKLWVARVAGVLGICLFTVMGITWEPSWDLPWHGSSGNERYGFFRNGLPRIWTCDDGHDHYSLPFWAGAVACAVPTALWWLVWPRKNPVPTRERT
jgi:hypothetical protein